jgi:hypothetical protein
MTFMWTDENVAALRDMHEQKMPAPAIGLQLGVSKGTILGKLRRLGLFVSAVERWAALRANKRAKGKVSVSRRSHPEIMPRKVPAAPAVFVGAISSSRPVELVGLTNVTCRWPINEGSPVMFCGAPEANLEIGCPYCVIHTLWSRRRGGAE